ncbi:MAG: glycosyltransferase family 4 protein [Anaerolineae bacterium]|nr:glycosyltransferase family 4 protein [Anaerolineae bacterium]
MVGRAFLQEPIEIANRLGLTQDQVCFLGEISHEELITLYKQSHVFAAWMTGRFKSLGTAPMEAMLCEVPVVTDIPEDLFGKARLVDGQDVILVNSLNPKSIASGIIKVLENEKLRQTVGVNGRNFVLENLSWSTIARQVALFFQEVLNRTKK